MLWKERIIIEWDSSLIETDWFMVIILSTRTTSHFIEYWAFFPALIMEANVFVWVSKCRELFSTSDYAERAICYVFPALPV